MIGEYFCYHCGGETFPEEIDYETRWGEQRVLVRGVPVLRCTRCHEIFLTPDVLDAIEKIAREKPRTGEPEMVIHMPVRAYRPLGDLV